MTVNGEYGRMWDEATMAYYKLLPQNMKHGVCLHSVIHDAYLSHKIVPVLFFSTEHHGMGAYWGSGGIVLRIFGLGTKWR
jgi:hypothetical protein